MFTSLVLSGGGEVIERDLLIGNDNIKQRNKSKGIFSLNFVRCIKSSLVCIVLTATSAFTSYRLIRRGVHSGTRRLVLCDFENLRSTLNINFNQPVLKKSTLKLLQ